MKPQDDAAQFSSDTEIEYVSKTQLKKEADDLKKLGLEILALTPKNRASLPMDEELSKAFLEATKINRKKDGFRRQIQFIGKLLRQRDVAELQLALAKINASHQSDVDEFHALEVQRDRLIAQGDDAIQALIDEKPHADRQKLRHLVRQAIKEQKNNKPPAASREIFKYLRTL